MAKTKNGEKLMMVRMRDSSMTFVNSDQDIRGHKVVNHNQEVIGKVKELFLDQSEGIICFLEISSGGFLGLGETKFLVPVDAIADVKNDEVRIGHPCQRVLRSSSYAPELVDARVLTDVYDHSEYIPYWAADYTYPSFPNSTQSPG